MGNAFLLRRNRQSMNKSFVITMAPIGLTREPTWVAETDQQVLYAIRTGLESTSQNNFYFLPNAFWSRVMAPEAAPWEISQVGRARNRTAPQKTITLFPDYITVVNLKPNYFVLLMMNELEESIRFSVDFSLRWIDPKLKWTPSAENGNLTTIKVPERKIWVPDIYVFTAVDTSDLLPASERIVEVSYKGRVAKTLPEVLTTPCELSVADFPFDEQTCTFTMGPWAYSMTELLIEMNQTEWSSDDLYKGNTEWEFRDMKAEIEVDDGYNDGTAYHEVVFSIRFRRKWSYYFLVFVLPSFICCTLCIFGLFIPSEATRYRYEKVNLGVATLLAMAMILEAVADSMPKSDTLPRLGTFILAEMILCAIGVLVTCVFSVLHERATTRGWLPKRWIAQCLLCRRYDRKIRQRHMSIQDDPLEKRPTRLSHYLTKINNFVVTRKSDEQIELQWSRIFDRLDIISLVIFQFINLVMSVVILLV